MQVTNRIRALQLLERQSGRSIDPTPLPTMSAAYNHARQTWCKIRDRRSARKVKQIVEQLIEAAPE